MTNQKFFVAFNLSSAKADSKISYTLNGKVEQVVMPKGSWCIVEDIININQVTNLDILTKLGVGYNSDSFANTKLQLPFGTNKRVEANLASSRLSSFAARFNVVPTGTHRAVEFSSDLLSYIASSKVAQSVVGSRVAQVFSSKNAKNLDFSSASFVGARLSHDKIDYSLADIYLVDFGKVTFENVDFSKTYFKNPKVDYKKAYRSEKIDTVFSSAIGTVVGSAFNGLISLTGVSTTGVTSGGTFNLTGKSSGDTVVITGIITGTSFSGGVVVLSGTSSGGTLTYNQFNPGNLIRIYDTFGGEVLGGSVERVLNPYATSEKMGLLEHGLSSYVTLEGLNNLGKLSISGTVSGGTAILTGESKQGLVSLGGSITSGDYVGGRVSLLGTIANNALSLTGVCSGTVFYELCDTSLVGTYETVDTKAYHFVNEILTPYSISENKVSINGNISGGGLVLRGYSSNGTLNLSGIINGGDFNGGFVVASGKYLKSDEIVSKNILSFRLNILGSVVGEGIANTTISLNGIASEGSLSMSGCISSGTSFSFPLLIRGDETINIPNREVVGVGSGLFTNIVNLGSVEYGNLDFCDVDFTKVNFCSTNVEKIDPRIFDFSKVDFSKVDYKNVDFSSVKLSSSIADLDLELPRELGIATSRADFSEVQLKGAFLDFSNVDYRKGLKLESRNKLLVVNLDRVDFTNTINFNKASFIGLKIKDNI